MASIANLAVQLTANTGGFTGGLQKASGSLDRFKKQTTSGMGSINKALGGLPAWGAGFVGLGSASAFAAIGISKVVDAFGRIDEIGDQAQMLGASVESLSSLNFAANILDAESFSSSIEKLSVNLGKAYHETGTQRDALRELGLSEKALVDIPLDEQLLAISRGMSNIKNESDKSRLAVALFGKSGLDMKNMLGDVDALTAAIAEAKDIGALVTAEDAAAIGEADQAMKRLKASTEGLANVVAVKLAPAVAGLSNGLAGHIAEKSVGGLLMELINPVGAAADFAFKEVLSATGIRGNKAEAATLDAAPVITSGLPEIPEDMQKEADRLKESMMTPNEKFDAEMTRLGELLDSRAINQTTFDRAAAEYAKERDKDAIKAQEEKQNRIDQILEQSMTPMDEYTAGFEELSALLNEGSILPEQYLKSLKHLNEVFENSDPVLKERARREQQMSDDASALTEQTRNPFERFNADIESARALLDQGLITDDTFNRAAFASDQQNIQPLRDEFNDRRMEAIDAQLSEAQKRRDLLANTGEFKQVTNTSRLALGGGSASDPQVRMLDVQTRQLAMLRDIARQTRDNYAMAG